MKLLFPFALLAATAAPALAPPVLASMPVPRTVVACVIGGEFKGQRYTYRVHVLAGGERRPVDLRAYEGMTLRIKGYLLPGDHLTLRSLEIVSETCAQ